MMIQPPAAIAAKAHVRTMEEYQRQYRLSLDDPEGFWLKQAEILTWFHPPQPIFDADLREVDFSWYGGGRLNACHNCVDRHLATRRDKPAIIWAEDEPGRLPVHHLPRAQAPGGADRQRPARPRCRPSGDRVDRSTCR